MLKWIFLAVPFSALMSAQMPMGGGPMGGRVCGKAAHDLNLTETQQGQITGICKEFSKKVFELHDASKKAEAELQAAFDESPVDQGKSNVAIEHLTAARSDLFRTTSQMDLKIRMVLTDEQWQELKKRDRRGPPGGPGRPGGPWRRGGPSKGGTGPTTGQQQQNP
jgi:Spy/CpxP family protein refolding chaperone